MSRYRSRRGARAFDRPGLPPDAPDPAAGALARREDLKRRVLGLLRDAGPQSYGDLCLGLKLTSDAGLKGALRELTVTRQAVCERKPWRYRFRNTAGRETGVEKVMNVYSLPEHPHR